MLYTAIKQRVSDSPKLQPNHYKHKVGNAKYSPMDGSCVQWHCQLQSKKQKVKQTKLDTRDASTSHDEWHVGVRDETQKNMAGYAHATAKIASSCVGCLLRF